VSATYVAGGSVGSLLPMTLQGVAALDASAALILPQLAAKLEGAIKSQLALVLKPPGVAGSIDVATRVLASLNLAITAPGAVVDFSAIAALIAEVVAALGSLAASAALAASLTATFGHAGLHLYKLEGAVNQWGSDLSSVLSGGLPGGGPADQGFALVLAAGADPGTIAILKLIAGL
jgi:hypothetical protein